MNTLNGARPKQKDAATFHWLCHKKLCSGVLAAASASTLLLPPNYTQDQRGVWTRGQRAGHRNPWNRAFIEGALAIVATRNEIQDEEKLRQLRKGLFDAYADGKDWISLDTLNILWRVENFFPLIVQCPRCKELSKINSKLGREESL